LRKSSSSAITPVNRVFNVKFYFLRMRSIVAATDLELSLFDGGRAYRRRHHTPPFSHGQGQYEDGERGAKPPSRFPSSAFRELAASPALYY